MIDFALYIKYFFSQWNKRSMTLTADQAPLTHISIPMNWGKNAINAIKYLSLLIWFFSVNLKNVMPFFSYLKVDIYKYIKI